MADTNNELVEKIDKLIEEDDLSTKTGLKLAFSALRDAITLMSIFGNKVDTIEKKVNVMWTGYQVVVWAMSVFGVAMIMLIWALITGQASLSFGKP
jgi:hypothetical protein